MNELKICTQAVHKDVQLLEVSGPNLLGKEVTAIIRKCMACGEMTQFVKAL